MCHVSVIMPVFNQERFISAAIEAVLAQSYSDFELIVVDDGSTDATIGIIETFTDRRIKLIRQQHGGFISALRNAMRNAKGKWLARMDSDDLCAPHRLARQIEFLESNPDYVFCTSAYNIITLNGNKLVPQIEDGVREIGIADISNNTTLFCDPASVFLRELAVEVDYDTDFESEKAMWYRVLARGRGALISEPLYSIRWRLGSVSRGQVKYDEAFSERMRKKYDPEYVGDGGTKEQSVHAGYSFALKTFYVYLAAGDIGEARRIGRELIRQMPTGKERLRLAVYLAGLKRAKSYVGPAGICFYPADDAPVAVAARAPHR